MTTAKAEGTGFLVSREAEGARGIPLATGWFKLQPNPGGIQGTTPDFVDVNRDPLSTFATDEKGDHVGLDAKITVIHDLNKDLIDRFGEGWTRSIPKSAVTTIFYPTAAVDGGGGSDSFTVAAGGAAILDGMLFMVRGPANAANRGVFVANGTSTGIAVKVATATLVAEAFAVAGSVSLEQCGVQGIADDIKLDASGNLTSTTLDFTTLGLLDGHQIKIGDDAAGTRFSLVSDTYNGYATVSGAVTAHLITLKWHTWTPAAADAGTGKTIRLFYGRLLRNVATDHATDYIEPSWTGEKQDNGVGTANAAVFTVLKGMTINTVSIQMAVKSKIVVTHNFVGMDITSPTLVASRIAGPSAAYPALATEMFDTSNDLILCKVYSNDDQALLIAEVNSATLSIDHGVTPLDQLATFGAAGMNFGKIRPKVAMEIQYARHTVPIAQRANTSCRWSAIMRNGQAGITFHIPGCRLTGGQMTYAGNLPVMMALEMPAHRDPTTNQVLVVNVMPYVPLT